MLDPGESGIGRAPVVIRCFMRERACEALSARYRVRIVSGMTYEVEDAVVAGVTKDLPWECLFGFGRGLQGLSLCGPMISTIGHHYLVGMPADAVIAGTLWLYQWRLGGVIHDDRKDTHGRGPTGPGGS